MSRSRERAEKEQVINKLVEVLNIEDYHDLVGIVQSMLQVLSTPPTLVSFAFDMRTGQVQQVASSQIPNTPEAYQALSQVTASLAQRMGNTALEVAKRRDEQKQEEVKDNGATNE
jgi:hypothetical protein